MAEDSSDNAFSFAGHAAAPAASTESNSSQSIDTGGSDNSELRTQIPRRALVAPRGRQLPTIPAIEDADSTPGKYILESAFTDSGIGSYQKVNVPASGSYIFTVYQDELTEYKISLDKATEEESVLQARLHEMAAYANQQLNFLENTTHQEMTSMAQQLQILNSELFGSAGRRRDDIQNRRVGEVSNYVK